VLLTFKQIQDQAIKRFKSSLRPDLKTWILDFYSTVWALEEWSFRYAAAAVTVTAGSANVTNLPADLGMPIGLVNANGDDLDEIGIREYYRRYTGTDSSTSTPEAFCVIGNTIKVGPVSNESSSSYQLLYERAPGHYVSTTLAAAVTLPQASIQVASTSEFAASGQAWVGGRLVTYTSKDATHLLGCSGGSGTIALSDLVVSTVALAGAMNADSDVPLLPDGTHLILVHGGQATGQALENDPTTALSDTRVDRILNGMRRNYLVSARVGGRSYPADPLG
jgi:hypothetical protein